jgi:tetratricopeptide (TPR) repeat protein
MLRNILILLSLLLVCSIVLPGLPLRAHQDLLLQIEQLDGQISEDPQNTELLIKRGDLYRRHGDWASAEDDFEMVRELSPDHSSIDWFQGRLLVSSGRNEEGIILLTRFVEQDPNHGGAYRVRAEARWNLQQPLLAALDYQLAVNNSERPSPSLYRSLVLSLVAAGADHTDEAIAVVDDGLNRFAGEISLLGLGADLSLSQKKPGLAQFYLRKIPSRLNALPQWQFRQAILVCVKGDEDKAAERFSVMLTYLQGNGPQRAGTWVPPLDVITGLVAQTSVDDCGKAAWETLRQQQP